MQIARNFHIKTPAKQHRGMPSRRPGTPLEEGEALNRNKEQADGQGLPSRRTSFKNKAVVEKLDTLKAFNT